MKKQVGIKEFPKNHENPFIDGVMNEVKWKTKNQLLKSKNGDVAKIVVGNDGEVEAHSVFMRQIEVDEERFAKLYLTQFESFWELKPAAIRVFGYLLKVLKPNEDRVYIDYDECLEYTKYTNKRMLFYGFANLMDAGIIARSNMFNMFYINPLVVFNGSRVTFAKTYIKKKKQLMLENPNQTSLLDLPGVKECPLKK